MKKYKEVLTYIFWAVMTTLVSWASYTLYENAGLSVTFSNILSWITAVTFSFAANKIRVFESKSWDLKTVIPEITKFFSTRLAIGVVEWIAVPLFVYLGVNERLLGTDGLLSKIVVTPMIILLNYLCGKFIVFRKK